MIKTELCTFDRTLYEQFIDKVVNECEYDEEVSSRDLYYIY